MVKELDIQNPSIVINEKLNKELNENGYTIFPFLSENDIEQLTQYYFEFQKETPNHFYSSSHSPDMSFRQRTSDYIKKMISTKTGQFLQHHRLLGGAFVVKPGMGKGILQPHQDWNLVDEEKYRSYNLWVPLTDVTIENGAMFVLPGSHNKIKSYRGPGIDSPFKEVEQQTWSHLKVLNMKAGEALLYDHALLHGSPANKTENIRLGVVMGIISEEATMQLHAMSEGKINVYACDEDFFLQKNPMQDAPYLKKLKTLPEIPQKLNLQQFSSIFLKPEPSQKTKQYQNFFSHLLQKITRQ